MWLDEDTQAALEWQEWDDARCSGCGHPRYEAWSPEMESAYEAVPMRCHACAERERAGKRLRKIDPDGTEGLYVHVVEEVES